MIDKNKTFLSYKEAGVDIHAGNILIERIKNVLKKTQRPELISELGDFSAICTLPQKYKEPVLVSSTDGVGTKLRLIMNFKRHNSIGIDLVAMCVNDIITQGAEPLFFLDYYATGKLNIDIAENVIASIAEGCFQSGCMLVGGETAEMPGMYNNEDYDIAGFCVGIVEKSKIINSLKKIQDGDILIALASSGLHSNGYSLVQKILKINKINPNNKYLDGRSLINHLLTPTRIYVKNILTLTKQVEINGIAHITGGGLWGNIKRILPNKTQAIIYSNSWKWPKIFHWLRQEGNVHYDEMYNTFNCGVGMVIALNPKNVTKALKLMNDAGEIAWEIGIIKMTNSEEKVVIKQ